MNKVFCTILALVSGVWGVSAVDWAQVEADWQKQADDAALEMRDTPYTLQSADTEIYRGAIPELAIGVHNFDAKVAEDLRQAHIVSTRHTIYWYHIENTETPGVYDAKALADLDALIGRYEQAGIEPNFVVHGNAPGIKFLNRQEGYLRFAAFMGFLAKRYPQVRFWELWNEMDVAFTDLFGAMNDVPMKERGQMYAEMLKVVYPAIKAANPDAVVVAGGLGHFNDFASGIYAGGGKDYFDVMNVHSYGIPVKYQFLQSALKMRELMNANGDQDKPIWNTEFGAGAEGLTSAWGVPAEDTVARYDQMQLEQLSTCIELNLATRVYQKCFIYAYRCGLEGDEALRAKLREKVGDTNLDDLGYTLTRADGSWRPAFQYLVESNPNYDFFAQSE